MHGSPLFFDSQDTSMRPTLHSFARLLFVVLFLALTPIPAASLPVVALGHITYYNAFASSPLRMDDKAIFDVYIGLGRRAFLDSLRARDDILLAMLFLLLSFWVWTTNRMSVVQFISRPNGMDIFAFHFSPPLLMPSPCSRAFGRANRRWRWRWTCRRS